MMRASFPALQRRPGWTYLDSAATTLLHERVLAAVNDTMAAGGSAGRATHRAGSDATTALEAARARIATHIGGAAHELVFCRSATEGLNLVAQGWGRANLLPSDRIATTVLEHHSNLLPWRATARETGARLETIGCTPTGDLDLDALDAVLDRDPRVLAIVHVSNVTGAVLPLTDIVSRVRARTSDCRIVVDGSQAIAHLDIDVAALGVDAYVFSGHKAYGPSGAGVVWASAAMWDATEPLLWGGGMVADVQPTTQTLVDAPWRFEAGTPNHAAAVGLAAGLELCGTAPAGLADAAAAAIAEVPGCRVLGDPARRVGVVSWVMEAIHSHDASTLLDLEGLAVRGGHLCAQPTLAALGANAALRASFGAYNTADDIGRLVEGLHAVRRQLRVPA